jgi:hypothetical protein
MATRNKGKKKTKEELLHIRMKKWRKAVLGEMVQNLRTNTLKI